MLLNITNDHLDWHGSLKNYVNSKFKIFKHQSNAKYSIINKKFEATFKKKNILGKLVTPDFRSYKKLKPKLKTLI